MIALYCPDVPPVPGGVSDHTLALARAIHAGGAKVCVFARRGDAARFGDIPCWTGLEPTDLPDAMRRAGAKAILIQYVPFLWARRGISPKLVRGVGALAEAGFTIATFVHEPFVPFTRLPWLVTGVAQRLQFNFLLRRTRFAYAPLARFADFARRQVTQDAVVRIVPVGATVPVSPLTRAEARRALGIADDTIAIGIFSPAASGFAHDWIAAAATRLAKAARVRWVRFGFGSARELPGYPAGDGTIIAGEGSPAAIADIMRALDLAAAPYVDGLTMRRSGAMLALATGIPTVSSTGHLFDGTMRELARCESTADAFGAALLELAQDAAARRALAERASGYARLASMERLAEIVTADLGAAA